MNTIAEKLIARAHAHCEASFMDYPDYDPDIPMTVADALVVLLDEHHEAMEVEMGELYDYFKGVVQEEKSLPHPFKRGGKARTTNLLGDTQAGKN